MKNENKRRDRILAIIGVTIISAVFGITLWAMTKISNVQNSTIVTSKSSVESNQPQKIFSIDENGFHLNLSADFDKNKISFEESDSVYIENDGLYPDAFHLKKEELDKLTNFLFDGQQESKFSNNEIVSADTYQLAAINYNWDLNVLSLCIYGDKAVHSHITYSLDNSFKIANVSIGE